MTGDGGGRVVACLPTRNAEAFIGRTLESLARQTYPNFQVLISDDASTDRTVEICARMEQSDPRFTLIRQPARLGWIGNSNALMREARGDFLFFAFHDDFVHPTYVARLVAELNANPQAVLAFSDVELVEVDGSSEIRSYHFLDGVAGRLERTRRMMWQRGDWWLPNRGVFRAAAFDRIQGLKTHLAGEYCADWPWLTHMALLGEFVRVPEVLCTKVFTKQSLSRTWSTYRWAWIGVTLSCAREIIRSDLPGYERALLLGALGSGRLDKAIRRLALLLAPGRPSQLVRR